MTPPKSDGGVTLDLKNKPYSFKNKLIMILPIVSKKQLGQIMNPSCWKNDLQNKWGHFRFEIWAFLLSH